MNIVLNDNMNESSGKAGKGFYPNTELGIDLKLMTKEPGRMAVGEYLDGAITHDEEDHFTFVQNDQEKKLQKVAAAIGTPGPAGCSRQQPAAVTVHWAVGVRTAP